MICYDATRRITEVSFDCRAPQKSFFPAQQPTVPAEDRIIVSLMVLYGLVNWISSYAGTSMVHYLQADLNTP